MATVTWDGSTDTDYGTAANWDTGSVPTSSDDVIIANVSNDCVLDGSRSVNSFVVQAGGDFNGNAETLTVVGENGSGFAVDIDGDIVGTNTGITITTPTTTSVDFNATAGNVRDLTINHASCVVNSENTCELSRNLTITAGTFNANGNNLTVAGKTSIGPNTGAADDAKLTCGSGTISLGSGKTDDNAIEVLKGGTFDGGSGTHTSGAINISTNDNAAAKIDFTSGNHTINSEYTSANRFFELTSGTVTHSNGTIILDSAVSSEIQWSATTGDNGPYNLTLNDSGMTVRARNALTILNDLTITAGTYNTHSADGGADKDLTVTGATSIDGTLTCNSSAISLGSNVDDAYSVVVNANGTFTGGSGTHTLGAVNVSSSANNFTFSSGTTTINGRATSGNSRRAFSTAATNKITAAGTLIIDQARTPLSIRCDDTTGINNLTMNCGSGRVLHLDGDITVGGDLNVSAGTVSTRNVGDTVDNGLTVTGLCTVNGILTGNASAISAGGFLVGSSGKYNATSGTTTITSEDSTGFAWDVNGTDSFDNNDGTVLFNLSAFGMDTHVRTGQSDGANSFHHLTVLLNASTNTLTMRPNAGTVMTVEGNLTVQEGVVQKNTHSHTLTVTGDVSIESGGKIDATSASGANNFGSLTIASGGTYTATSGTTTITSEASSGYAWNRIDGGTFTDNDGTVSIGNGSGSIGTTHIRENRFHHLTINRDASSSNTIWRNSSGSTLTIDGNLTITKGFFYRNTVTSTLTVTGSVDIAANGSLGLTADTGANNFGGIRINSGGAYYATSGTTTVTNRFTGTSNLWKNDGGTFTHNNGTVKFTDNDHSLVKELTFYNLEQASSLGDYALSWETQSGTACTILGNLTITRGDFEISAAGNTLDIHGQTILNGSSDTGARFNNDKNQTGTITHHGIVTINGGTYHVEDGATVNMTGIRNLGGVVD
jgi:hypothetical protein